MCKRQPTTIAALLKATLEPQWLVDTARQEGLFVRARKLEPYAFLWVLLLGWTSQRRPSISSLHRTYARRTGNDIVYSSFRDKLAHPACAFWLQTCLWHVIECTSMLIPKPNHPIFNALSNAVAIDSTLIHLHASLADKFPSTYPKRAAIKFHAAYNVIHGTALKLKLSKGTLHDRKGLFQIGPWVKNRLILFDLGYWSHQVFKSIDKAGGFFVSRLKSNVKVVIDKDNRERALGSMTLEGKSLWDILTKIRRQELDIQATIGVGAKSFQARVVGVRNQDTGRWHLYVTNIKSDRANVEFIVYLYRKRWQIEIVFKMLRSVGRLDQLTSSDERLMRTQIWAAVLRVALGQLVALVTRQKQGLTKGEVRNLKAQRVWTELHGELLSQMVQPEQPQDLFKCFFKYAQDINRRRWNLFDIIAKLAPDGFPVFQ